MSTTHAEHKFHEPITCYVCGNHSMTVYRDVRAQDYFCGQCLPIVRSITALLEHCVNNPQQFGLCHPSP